MTVLTWASYHKRSFNESLHGDTPPACALQDRLWLGVLEEFEKPSRPLGNGPVANPVVRPAVELADRRAIVRCEESLGVNMYFSQLRTGKWEVSFYMYIYLSAQFRMLLSLESYINLSSQETNL